MTLPDATKFYFGGKTYTIKNGAGVINATIVTAVTGQLIDTVSALGSLASVTIWTDGLSWYVAG